MKQEKEKITIELDNVTAYILKDLARIYKKSLPKLIEELCKDHIEDVMKVMNEEIENTSQNKGIPT